VNCFNGGVHRRGILIVCLVAVVAALAGCGSSGKQAEQQQTTTGSANKPAKTTTAPPGAGERCLPVSSQLLSRIQSHVVLDGGKLNNPKAVASPEVPGLYFISAHVTGGGAGNKMVATWATQNLDGHGRIFAVDDSAALVSTYGSIYSTGILAGINSEGAFKSRVCSFGKDAPKGGPAPESGGPGGNPAG
jgi:hypothetical protein